MQVLHVGLGRTGSTYLQKVVFPSFSDVLFLDKDSNIKAFSLTGSEQLRSQIQILIDQTQKMLVSDEGLISHNPYFQVTNLASLFSDATIVICLRNQIDRIESEYIKARTVRGNKRNGQVRNIRMYLNQKIYKLLGLMSYDTLIGFLNLYFKNVNVYFFEEIKADNFVDFKNQIAELMGVDVMNHEHNETFVHSRYNPATERRPSPKNLLSAFFGKENSSLTESDDEVRTTILEYRVKGVPIIEQFRRQNALLEQRLGRQLPSDYNF